MKHFNDLNACIAILEDVQRGNDITPKQKQAIKDAIGEIKGIRRRPNSKRHEIHRSVRSITENLVRAFIR
jgi:hypothetical protein